ncbi:MAG: PaaX family transcriptional regulator [Rhodobacteraceae bacterium]|nr:PaaX family transcriptional regulator [Paracoccaceae bacterium]
MTATAFEKSLDALQQNDQRVWSLIVTLFGDMAQGEQDRISASQLAKITDILGIKPEATRVALHRLRKTGWLISEKSGRNSRYALSEFGRAQSISASARIYGETMAKSGDWHVLVLPAKPLPARNAMAKPLLETGYVALNNSVLLGHGAPPEISEFMVLLGSDGPVPDWVKSLVFPAKLDLAFSEFIPHLQLVKQNLPADFTSLETIALRVLLVHHWRKLVLRVPDLPAGLLPRNLAEPQCRQLVCEILQQLGQPDLTGL